MPSDFDIEFKGRFAPLRDITALTQFLQREVNVDSRRTAILTGCYMVAYDRQAHGLAPLIPEEHQGGVMAEAANTYGGDFPLKTLGVGVEVYGAAQERVKLVLLVNDHQLFIGSERDPRAELNLGVLRRQYFRNPDAVPRSYLAHIASRKYDPDAVLFELVRGRTDRHDIMPAKSRLISEKYLLNRFDESTRHRLEGYPGFSTCPKTIGQPDVSFSLAEAPSGNGDVPLSSSGCGCTVIILELALMLQKRGIEHLIILTPDECHVPVNGASQAAIYGMRTLPRITVVSGLGRMLGVGPSSRHVIVWQYPE